jgi:threonine synthase
MRRAASLEGISLCPESAVCLDVLADLVREKRVEAEEMVVVFNTGAAQKYPEVVPLELPRIDKDRAVDWEALVREAS